MNELTDFEPHAVKRVDEYGNIYAGRKNRGKVAYVYYKRYDDADNAQNKVDILRKYIWEIPSCSTNRYANYWMQSYM